MKAERAIVAKEVIERATNALQRVVSPMEGVRMALLCTPDGFEIASLTVGEAVKAARVAAMGGSLMAMARAVGREVGYDECSRITFETGAGVVVFQAIQGNTPCILGLLMDSSAMLGRALWATNEVAQDMARAT